MQMLIVNVNEGALQLERYNKIFKTMDIFTTDRLSTNILPAIVGICCSSINACRVNNAKRFNLRFLPFPKRMSRHNLCSGYRSAASTSVRAIGSAWFSSRYSLWIDNQHEVLLSIIYAINRSGAVSAHCVVTRRVRHPSRSCRSG